MWAYMLKTLDTASEYRFCKGLSKAAQYCKLSCSKLFNMICRKVFDLTVPT